MSLETAIDRNEIGHENEARDTVSSISMTVILISFSMLFASLFLGYVYFRLNQSTWPPMGMDKLSLTYPFLSTVFIFMSSLIYLMMEKWNETISLNKVRYSYLLVLLFGLGFFYSQFELWSALEEINIFAGSGIFGSILHGFTWIHAAHVVIGYLCLLYLIPSIYFNNKKQIDRLKLKNVGKFWHFLGLVWLIMFVSIFVL